MTRRAAVLFAAAVWSVAAGCAPGARTADVETTSLLGRPLRAPELDERVRTEREQALARALEERAARPDDLDATVWAGRRTAYLGRYREAVEIYTEGLERHGEHPVLLRHRGHRFITLRRFERAVRDLTRAGELIAGRPDEVEPDGLPNARNQPTSTLHSNIWYHLGLAHYLRGDFERAAATYRRCLEVSRNPDMLVATSHWLYMALRRAGRDDEAMRVLEPIHEDLDIIENHTYHELLLMYRGERSADALAERAMTDDGGIDRATLGYGVGNWFLYHGAARRAESVFRRVVEGTQWAAFGYIAAEAELARGLGGRPARRAAAW